MESSYKENNLECRALKPDNSDALGVFFAQVVENGDDKLFHPHSFDYIDACNICKYEGKDIYYAIFSGENILGYGLLRGWDDGYEIPSLGIAISRTSRGLGLGKMFMLFLHCAAKNNGAKKVRLTVDKSNTTAIKLYKALGYCLESYDDNQYLGIIELQ